MKSKIILIILIVACFLAAAGYALMYTTAGSKFAVNHMISNYVDHEGLTYEGLNGNLAQGIVFENLEIKDLNDLPPGSILKIQKLSINVTSFSLNGIHVEIENTRLKLSDSDPIIISGSIKEQQLNINIFSNGFSVREVVSYLPDLKSLIPIKGDVNNVDIFVTGELTQPNIKGSFTIEKFTYKGFLLTNAPITFDFVLKDLKQNAVLLGNVETDKGELKTKRTTVVLDRSYLKFLGPWDQPQMNVKGSSKIEKTKISLSLQGTVKNPDLSLSSEPSYSRQKLMIMLATGKQWKSVDDSIDHGVNSLALTKDFVDYFFFAGQSNEFAKRFGISDFSITYNQDQKGISAKKELSEKLQIGYGIEQTQADGQITDYSQKLEGEYKVSEKVSVGVEREIKSKQSEDTLDEYINQKNDKVLLKYKKSF